MPSEVQLAAIAAAVLLVLWLTLPWRKPRRDRRARPVGTARSGADHGFVFWAGNVGGDSSSCDGGGGD